METISIDVKQAYNPPLAEFLLVIVIVLGHLGDLLVVDHFDADDAACEATVPRELFGKQQPLLRRLRIAADEGIDIPQSKTVSPIVSQAAPHDSR